MEEHNRRPQGVIFDLDGVLVDSEHLWDEVRHDYARDHGYAWTPEDNRAVMGMSTPEWSRFLAERLDSSIGQDAVASAVIAGMRDALTEGRIVLIDGATDLVAAAASRVPLAVASSSPRQLIEAVLTGTDLARFFRVMVSSEEVPRGKPAPDVYQEAARRLGVDPVNAIGIEDSTNGIRAAAAAGLTVIALPNPRYPPQPDALALCAVVAPSLAEVQTALIARLDGEMHDPTGP